MGLSKVPEVWKWAYFRSREGLQCPGEAVFALLEARGKPPEPGEGGNAPCHGTGGGVGHTPMATPTHQPGSELVAEFFQSQPRYR